MKVKERKLLSRVVSYYQHVLSENPQCLIYFNNLGIRNTQTIRDFEIGYVNGTLKNILPDDPEVSAILKKLGILNRKGDEAFNNCVVFPMFDQDGGIINLSGYNIETGEKLYLGSNGVINHQAVKRASTVLLTETVFDTLIIYDQGFKNVVPVHDTRAINKDLLSLFKDKVQAAYLLFHTAENEEIVQQLKSIDVLPYIVDLSDKNFCTYFNCNTQEEFEKLLQLANPADKEQLDCNNRSQTLYIDEEYGFTVGCGNRQYQIKGIQRGDTQLKVTIKVAKDVAESNNFELSTIDLYSSRSRQWFARLCCTLLHCAEELVKEDLGKILLLAEEWRPQAPEVKIAEPTEEEKQRACTFLKNPELFSEILKDFDALGIRGEETNKLVGYLAATSRKLPEPLSVLIQSRSAAGKSTIQDAILQLIPPEDFIQYTRLTDQALFYKEEDALVHKILAIEEAEGMGGAAYSIRNIQTARKITVAVTAQRPTWKNEDRGIYGQRPCLRNGNHHSKRCRPGNILTFHITYHRRIQGDDRSHS